MFFVVSAQQSSTDVSRMEYEILQQLAAKLLKDSGLQTPSQGFIPPTTHHLVQDITFAIADLKFNPETGTIKLLEFGDGARSKYMGYDRLHGVGALWAQFWNYLSQFGLPMWCIRMPGDPASRNTMSPSTFFGLGGKTTSGVADLQRKLISTIFEQQQFVSLQDCFNYKALALVRWGRAAQATARFKTIFSNVLFVGDPINELIRNKYYTNQLFVETELQQYRPKCIVCPRQYSPELASQIIAELQSNIVVIKPPNASKGRGIIMAHQEELDSVLKLILLHPEQIENKDPDTSLGYWTTDESMGNTIFLAEEYIASKNIIVEGKIYDPTLRLVFALHKDHEGSHVTFFDGYWKLPAKSLTEEGTLTEKHKSDVSANAVSSAKLSPEDFQVSTNLLRPALLKLHNYILQDRENEERSCSFIFSNDDQDSI